MKKIIIIGILNIFLVSLFSLLFTNNAYSQTITQGIKEQLITNIASRVAQLRLVEKRGIIGTVTNATNTQITILDIQNNTRFVDVDELTKFSSPKLKTAYGISDITKGTTLGILGLYNKESRRILARFVNVVSVPIVVRGGVAAVDDKNFTVDIVTIDDKKLIIDIGYTTTTYSYTSSGGYIKSGFSKIKEGYSIITVGSLDPKNENKISATRVVIFPEIPYIQKTQSQNSSSQK
ncbi:MAG: hypothetical protein AAB583_04425 [Patescibacteria group bacterium]